MWQAIIRWLTSINRIRLPPPSKSKLLEPKLDNASGATSSRGKPPDRGWPSSA